MSAEQSCGWARHSLRDSGCGWRSPILDSSSMAKAPRWRVSASRSVVLAHVAPRFGAFGLVVHGGHVRSDGELETGIDNWRTLFERQQDKGGFAVPILIENTAGGNHAMARHFDSIARLWDAVGDFGAGFCLDTCHAWAGGEDLVGVVERIKAITGRIDLVHLNSSRDEFNSGADRHANFADGTIDPELLAEVCRTADAPVVLETPGEGVAEDLAYLREHVG